MMRLATLGCLITLGGFALGCSDDPSSDLGVVADSGLYDSGAPDSGRDTGVADTGNPVDSGAPDQGVSDSGAHDGGRDLGVEDDAAVEDGAIADASEPDAAVDGGLNCGRLGMACGGADQCGGGLFCGFAEICVPMDECGGFTRAQCPNTAPICMFYAGADIGPCFTALQRACICADPSTAALFVGC